MPMPDFVGWNQEQQASQQRAAEIGNNLTNMQMRMQQMQQVQQMMPLDMQIKQAQAAKAQAGLPYADELARLPIEESKRKREAAQALMQINQQKAGILQQQANIKQQLATLASDPNSPQNKTRILGFMAQLEKLDADLQDKEQTRKMHLYNAGFIDSPTAPIQSSTSQYGDLLKQMMQSQSATPQTPAQSAPQVRGPQGQMVTTDEQGRRVVIPASEQATASMAYDAGQRGEQIAMRPPEPTTAEVIPAPRISGQTPFTPPKIREITATQVLKGLEENYTRLRDVPQQLENIEAAKELTKKSGGFMGPVGPQLLTAAKLLNNRLGTSINVEGVKSAEEMRTRIFMNIMDNLKKMDAQPSQLQQQLMAEALGNLGTDPQALPKMLDAYGDAMKRKVTVYHKQVDEAKGVGIPWPHRIGMPEQKQSGSYIEIRKTSDGRTLGKKADGTIEVIQ